LVIAVQSVITVIWSNFLASEIPWNSSFFLHLYIYT